MKLFLACFLLTGCAPQCLQFDTNRNCAAVDFDLGDYRIENLSGPA